jgi:hypothetical protein
VIGVAVGVAFAALSRKNALIVEPISRMLQFTVEDEGVFTMPWSATVT